MEFSKALIDRLGKDAITSKQELLAVLRPKGIIIEGEFSGASGARLPYYTDIKRGIGYQDALLEMAISVGSRIGDKPDFVVGMGYGGVPLATALELLYGVHMTMIRDGPKNHGLPTLFDGYEPRIGDRGIAVDDVTTTGGSLDKMNGIVRKTGAEITDFYVIAKRTEFNTDITIAGRKVNYIIIPEELTGR